MITIPNKLYGEPFVDVIHQNHHFAILKKQIDQAIIDRQSYVSMHAVSLVVSGQQRIVENDGQFIQIQSGEIGFVKKGLYTVTDMLSSENGFQSYHLYFDDELLKTFLSLYPSTQDNTVCKPCFKIASSPTLLQYFTSLDSISNFVENAANQLFRIKLMEFLALVIAENKNILQLLTNFAQQKPQNLHAFMIENFDKPLTIEDYAYLTGRSLSTFSREFKTKFGLSPRKWITQQRMKKAKELLEKGTESVADTAYNIGYESVSHFISSFKKYYGHTPKQTPSPEKKLFF